MDPDALCECGDVYDEHHSSAGICMVDDCDCEQFDAADESAEIRARGESDER